MHTLVEYMLSASSTTKDYRVSFAETIILRPRVFNEAAHVLHEKQAFTTPTGADLSPGKISRVADPTHTPPPQAVDTD